MTKPVDVEQTEHEKTNQNWCAVATGLQVKTEAQAAEIKRLTDALEQIVASTPLDDEAVAVAKAALKEQS